jgi:anti-sigma factor RsiW
VISKPIELVVLTTADVSAFVDGELAPEERRDVEACARDDDRVTCLVRAWQWQLGLLYAAYGRTIEEPVPERLRRIVGQSERIHLPASSRRPALRRRNMLEPSRAPSKKA